MKTIVQIWQDQKNLLCLVALLAFGIYIQTYSIGKLVYTFPDEGIYLYAAKLVAQGHLIYRDFFLAHLPFWIYINAFILQLLDWNMDLYHMLYAFWVVSGAIPLYLIVYSVTKKSTPAVLACLIYLVFPEMMQWDAHLFAMRQASTPLLGWAMYHLICSRNYKKSGVFFAIFSMGLVTNFFVSFIIMGAWAVQAYLDGIDQPTRKVPIRKILLLLIPYLLLVGTYATVFAVIPNSINNVFGYQLNNQFIPYITRIMYIKRMLPINWVMFIFGFVGCFLAPRKLRWVGTSFLIIFPVITFASRTFYPHYLVILGLPFALSAGFFLDYLIRHHVSTIPIVVSVISIIYYSSGSHMYYHLVQAKSPTFYSTIDRLSRAPEPVFTFEPIYALYAKKSITYHYYVADPRSFRVLGDYYPEDVYITGLSQNNSCFCV